MITYFDTYTHGDGIITFYADGNPIFDRFYYTQAELNNIIDEETQKKR